MRESHCSVSQPGLLNALLGEPSPQLIFSSILYTATSQHFQLTKNTEASLEFSVWSCFLLDVTFEVGGGQIRKCRTLRFLVHTSKMSNLKSFVKMKNFASTECQLVFFCVTQPPSGLSGCRSGSQHCQPPLQLPSNYVQTGHMRTSSFDFICKAEKGCEGHTSSKPTAPQNAELEP